MSEEKLLESLNRTHRWEERSLLEHKKNVQNQAMYAVIHGGVNHELREKSLNFLTNLDFDGFAIGGSVGKSKDEMIKMLEFTIPKLPFNKPNHLLGIGDLSSLEMCMPIGIDTFDSSYPTKAARHGLLFSDDENIKIAKKKYFEDFSKICKNCSCYTCRNYSKAYLHHLFKANELTFYTLASIHNLTFMVNLMKKYREKILMDLI